MQNFFEEYQLFTDYMVHYLQDHKEYQEVIIYASKDRTVSTQLVSDLFDVWKVDPKLVGEFFEYWKTIHDN